MNRFYKYLKSFDRFILKHSKLLGLIFSVLALFSFAWAIIKVDFSQFNLEIRASLDICCGLLVFFVLNQVLDGFIWKYILKEFSISISLKESIKTNWKSHFYAIVTPNRIGDIPARRLLMKQENDLKTYKSATLHYIAKPIAFGFILIVTSCLMFTSISLLELSLLVGLIFGISYILFRNYRFVQKVILLNILRISIFCIQHIFILKLINFDSVEFLRLAFIHSSGALIPHVFGFEMVIKSVIFETFSWNNEGLLIFSLSLFILWTMNIVFPSLLSLTYKIK